MNAAPPCADSPVTRIPTGGCSQLGLASCCCPRHRAQPARLEPSAMGGVIARLRALFFSRRLEVVLVGLEGSGKTTFCNYLALGKAVEEPPTVVRG